MQTDNLWPRASAQVFTIPFTTQFTPVVYHRAKWGSSITITSSITFHNDVMRGLKPLSVAK